MITWKKQFNKSSILIEKLDQNCKVIQSCFCRVIHRLQPKIDINKNNSRWNSARNLYLKEGWEQKSSWWKYIPDWNLLGAPLLFSSTLTKTSTLLLTFSVWVFIPKATSLVWEKKRKQPANVWVSHFRNTKKKKKNHHLLFLTQHIIMACLTTTYSWTWSAYR